MREQAGSGGVGPSAEEVVVARHVASGGWQRAAIGFAIGILCGVAVALVLPREDGPRRRSLLEVIDDASDAVG